MAKPKTQKKKNKKDNKDEKRTVCPPRQIIVTPAFLDKNQRVIMPSQIFQGEEF